jgi:hypothetical protein
MGALQNKLQQLQGWIVKMSHMMIEEEEEEQQQQSSPIPPPCILLGYMKNYAFFRSVL